MLTYRREIDGLRAIAVLFVILFHAGFSSFKGGYIGVDVFFVISGYLITSIIWHETTNGTFSLKDFYERRIRRIAPVLFFVLFITIIPAWLFLWPSDLKDFSKSVISVVFFISNIFFLYNSGYFNTESELSPLIHTWSLSLEEQYYIVFPLIIIYLYNKGYKYLSTFLLFLSLVSLAACIIIPFYSQDAGFFLLPFRAWQLLLGALIAIRTPHINIIRPYIQNIMSLIGLTLIILSALLFNNKIPYPSFYALAPTIGTCLIIIFCTPNTFVGKVLSRRIFVSIGLVSYSAYLWHQPIFAFLRYEEMITPGSIEAFGVIIAVFILSFISWHYIEKPFRNKKAVSRKHVYIYTLLASIVIIIIGVLGIIKSNHQMNGYNPFTKENGLSFRQNIENHTDYDMYDNMYTDNKCKIWAEEINSKIVDKFRQCENTHGHATLVIGDSHAMNLYNIIAKSDVIPFLFGISKGACRITDQEGKCFYKNLDSFIKKNHAYIDKVIYTQTGRPYLEEYYKDHNISFSKKEVKKIDVQKIDTTIDYIYELSKHVDVIWLGPWVESHISKNKVLEGKRIVNKNSISNFLHIDRLIRNRIKHNNSEIKYISIIDALNDTTYTLWSGTCLIFRDRNHFSRCGEDMLAQKYKSFWKSISQ